MKDGWYRVTRGWTDKVFVEYFTSVEARVYGSFPDDYTIEPVIVMTQAEYDKVLWDAEQKGRDSYRLDQLTERHGWDR